MYLFVKKKAKKESTVVKETGLNLNQFCNECN